MKKSLGNVIYGIGLCIIVVMAILLVCALFFDAFTSVYRLFQLILMLGLIPIIVFAIIAIVKNLNRKRAIIGLVLSILGIYLLPWVFTLIRDLIK